jgi:hypothetical protein
MGTKRDQRKWTGWLVDLVYLLSDTILQLDETWKTWLEGKGNTISLLYEVAANLNLKWRQTQDYTEISVEIEKNSHKILHEC